MGKWAGREYSSPGGLGAAEVVDQDLVARAIAVVNSVGDVIDEDGRVIAGTRASHPEPAEHETPPEAPPMNTVLVVATVTASLEKRDVQWLAQRASDGITVSVKPAHTRYDGDVAFVVATPGPAEETTLDVLGPLVTAAVARAVRHAVVKISVAPCR